MNDDKYSRMFDAFAVILCIGAIGACSLLYFGGVN